MSDWVGGVAGKRIHEERYGGACATPLLTVFDWNSGSSGSSSGRVASPFRSLASIKDAMSCLRLLLLGNLMAGARLVPVLRISRRFLRSQGASHD